MDSFSDLAFFRLLLQQGTLAATAQAMGVTPPSVSKRLAALEARLGVRLLQRSTRRIHLTPEGELYLAEGRRLLDQMDELERRVAGTRAQPQGLIRMAATLGFGRRHIAPALSRFARAHPAVEVQLTLTDKPVNLLEDGFDLAVRLDELPDARLSARLLAHNRRLLCASPAYLRRAGTPTLPRELATHDCIVLRENEDLHGQWLLRKGSQRASVKVHGPLSGNDGDCALQWALDGHGILMRSEWDAAPYLRSGRLRELLPDWQLPPADVHLVFPTREHLPARTRALIEWLASGLERHRVGGPGAAGW